MKGRGGVAQEAMYGRTRLKLKKKRDQKRPAGRTPGAEERKILLV